MNTVAKGDQFENKSYELITEAVNNGELGLLAATAKVCRKPRYYSRDREKDIIFDLSIEIWLKDAEKYSNLYLIECKSTSKKMFLLMMQKNFTLKLDKSQTPTLRAS